MSEAVSATLVDLDDVDLVETHHRLDKSTDYSSATVMAHHLVTTEMLRRGMTHGHTDDGWSKLVIEVEKTFAVPVTEITSDMPEPVAQEVTAEIGEYADVTTLLSVEGYAMRFDKAQVDDPPVVQEALDEYHQVESETEPPEDLADTLNELLSGVVTLYFQAHGYHWNVTGPNFTQYHILFEEIYTDTYSSIDPLAENIRKLGGFPNWRLRDFFGMSEIEESDVLEGEAEELVPELLASTVVLIEELNEAFDAAIAENQQGIANFIAERIDAHQKWAWQLRASLSDSAWQALDDAEEERILATLTDADKELLTRLAQALDEGGDPEQFVPATMLTKSGNPDALRRYWRTDPKHKVGWGGPGDFTRCVSSVSKYMDSQQAKGFCAIRHREANGFWPGDKRNRTHKSAEPVEKFNRTGVNQYTHGGHAIGSMSRGETRRIGGSLGKRSAALHYNEGYDRAKQHMSAGKKPQVREHMGHLARARAGHATAQSHMERQTHAEHAVHSAGYLDAVAGRKRSIRRPLFGATVSDYATATKASEAEPVEKHPGNHDQKVHGRRGGGGSSSVSGGQGVTVGGGSNPRPGMGDHIPLDDKDFSALQAGSAGPHIIGRTPDGVPIFTPERQAMHDKIIADALAGVPSGRAEPLQVMLGGGPAAGKSQSLKEGSLTGVPSLGKNGSAKDAVEVNADDIKLQIPDVKARADAGDDSWAGYGHEESSYIAKRMTAAAQERRMHVVIDGTGDNSEESVTGKISQARKAGYRVTGRYVTCRTAEAQRRAKAREEETGRRVDPGIIAKTHKGVSSVVPHVASKFDDFELVDNDNQTGKTVLVATARRGRSVRVKDSGLWADFKAKAGEA
jgi:starvation-inducible DNA-binding protein